MILVLTNADTEILSLRVVAEMLPPGFPPLRAANPAHLDRAPQLDGVAAVIVRLLGGRQSWEAQFDQLRSDCLGRGVPLLAFSGEAVPDAELAALSTVPSATVTEAFRYLTQGGVENLANMLRFVADTVLMEGFGFDAPVEIPAFGVLPTAGAQHRPDRPTVAVFFYRAHVVSGNTRFVDELCDGIRAKGANALPVYGYSLRADAAADDGTSPRSPVVELLATYEVDAVITTVLAAGSLDEEAECWDAGALAELDVPVVQAICATVPSSTWESSSTGLSPMDVAMAVAIPEFDGRIVTVPFSFKETVDADDVLGSPVTAYRTRPDRVARVAGLAVRLARLRRTPPSDKRIAVVLSAYPTKRSRLGNAVGLDTPASVVDLLHALRHAGYRVDRIPASGDELMAELADALTYERDTLSPAQSARAVGRWSGNAYRSWFAGLPADLQATMDEAWGPAPGTVYVEPADPDPSGAPAVPDVELVFTGIDLGGVLVTVQPPRGFGENPIAVYHSPDLPPTHHYLGFYRWLDQGWGADAVVHVGKHGTLEWLPGKSVGLSASCFPDAALGDLPFIYPFVVNDPGEGTQAKRRTHAVIVDHLVPPLTRADLYDDLAKLEALLDTHAQVATLDPSKLPEVRRQVWEVMVAAEIHRDLGLHSPLGSPDGPPGDEHSAPAFDDPAFDDLLFDVDGYLCELKDAQIRGGLHVLGCPPVGDPLVEMVLAITRLPQNRVGSLRAEAGEQIGEGDDPHSLDRIEEECRRRVEACLRAGWRPDAVPELDDPGGVIRSSPVLAWVCQRLVPALAATTGEIDAVLGALDGRFIPPGPSGAPSRGMAHVLPTGRNFYSVDPKAIPSPLAWQVGTALADRLVERHLSEEGRYPTTVGLVVWGTAAMRTAGDDVAEILALIGVRPRWAAESGRVEGIELIPLAELGRPRVDVTVRISGFFRDAFPHVLALLDDAFALVAAAADEPVDQNPIARAGTADPRVFGPKPGAYGSGILTLLESRNWRTDDDLAEVYLAWGGYAYSRSPGHRDGSASGPGPVVGSPAPEALRRRLAAVEIAVKNQDNREHDIFDSDDYLQDHGGMVAAVRALTGVQPKAWFGDSSDPARPRMRSLAEEAARVVRSRVVNPKWLAAMQRHGYKGAFEMAATVDYLFGYDATAGVVEDWMYEKVTEAYVGDPGMRKFFEESNPWALRSIAERLLEADERGLWDASAEARDTLRAAVLEAEGWEESR
ncbi:MAG TPA: cobaltochelatase subunit CobN [Acidimicrobiales bacterium]|jgi:cobaltochelatase CobN|nr:cobaltochelatase subunit CobN [Acidimicrobiales bacterium]